MNDSAPKNKRPDSETPWYRAAKDAWYAWRDGRQISLGVKGKDNRPVALQAFYRLMSATPPAKRTKDKSQVDLQSVKSYNRSSNSEDTTNLTTDEISQLAQQLTERMTNKTAPATTASITVREMVDAFLQAKDGEVGAGTFLGYAKFARHFKQSFAKSPATSVTADEIEADSKRPHWSPTYRADYLATIVSAYRWAVRQRLIPMSPVEGVRKPPKASRGSKSVISDDEHKRLLSHADPEWVDLLTLLWHTGARPAEITGLTAEQVRSAHAVNGAAVVPLVNHKTAHKGKDRSLLLRGEALAVATRRADEVGTGLLFRGQQGQRLSPRAVAAKMSRLCSRAKARPVSLYGYRHTFATVALTRGLPDAQVAALLGHSDTTMLHKHYSHLTSQSRALIDALGKVRPDQ